MRWDTLKTSQVLVDHVHSERILLTRRLIRSGSAFIQSSEDIENA